MLMQVAGIHQVRVFGRTAFRMSGPSKEIAVTVP
jgi:hypothetical protein